MMLNNLTFHNDSKNKVIFGFSLAVALFWIMANMVNVYDYPVLGGIYEIFALPMVAGLFCMPVLAFIFWVKNKFSLRSLNLYSLIAVAIAAMVLLIIYR